MCNTLRKVTFFLVRDGFYPDLTPEEQADKEALARERRGYFHKWVKEVDSSGDIPRIKTMALVEDAEEGNVYMTEYNNIKFTEDWL